jgi:hypothetical protein
VRRRGVRLECSGRPFGGEWGAAAAVEEEGEEDGGEGVGVGAEAEEARWRWLKCARRTARISGGGRTGAGSLYASKSGWCSKEEVKRGEAWTRMVSTWTASVWASI